MTERIGGYVVSAAPGFSLVIIDGERLRKLPVVAFEIVNNTARPITAAPAPDQALIAPSDTVFDAHGREFASLNEWLRAQSRLGENPCR